MPATASDALVGWTADGTHVLFVSREGGLHDLMAVRVADGQAVERPFLIRTPQALSSLGVSQAGTLLYQSALEARTNLYRASFDVTSGRAGPPSRVDVSTGDLNGSASWSQGGYRLACVSWPQDKPARRLSIWSSDTGQTRLFSLPFDAQRWSWRPTTWSADGRRIYVLGSDDASHGALYRLNTDTGTAEAVVPTSSGMFGMKTRELPPDQGGEEHGAEEIEEPRHRPRTGHSAECRSSASFRRTPESRHAAGWIPASAGMTRPGAHRMGWLLPCGSTLTAVAQGP
jgi:hypothetical protein